jgi:SAM-dependent methyltransferase
VVSGSRIPEARVLDAGLGRPGAHRARHDGQAGLFTRSVLDYAAHQPGRVITVLQVGCATARGDLDLDVLSGSRHQVACTLMDDDSEVTRAVVASRPDLRLAVLADLRTVPLVPRSVDIVHCCLLLDRVSHAEIVLGRLVDALRPGGLLLLRVADRQSAAGFLDRILPRPLRGFTWRRLRPGEPGPHPAIYEPLTSARGVQAFTARHGLVVSRRESSSGLADRPQPLIGAARALVSAFSRGRLTAAHDQLGFVIRKPEDQFARVL